MKTVFSDRHEMQRVETEFYRGKWVEAFEIPRRALLVLDAVQRADLGPIVEPESFDLAPVLAVHDPDFVRFLQNIWAEWVAEVGPIPAYPNIWPPRRTRMIPTVRPGAELGRYAVDMSSPILEGVQAIAVKDFGPDAPRGPKTLIIVSDLLQNQLGFSLYQSVPALDSFWATPYGVSVRSNLAGIHAEIYLLRRVKVAAKQTDALGKFWIDWLERQGAQVDAFKSVPG